MGLQGWACRGGHAGAGLEGWACRGEYAGVGMQRWACRGGPAGAGMHSYLHQSLLFGHRFQVYRETGRCQEAPQEECSQSRGMKASTKHLD